MRVCVREKGGKTVRYGDGGSSQARREVRHEGIWQLFKKKKDGNLQRSARGPLGRGVRERERDRGTGQTSNKKEVKRTERRDENSGR